MSVPLSGYCPKWLITHCVQFTQWNHLSTIHFSLGLTYRYKLLLEHREREKSSHVTFCEISCLARSAVCRFTLHTFKVRRPFAPLWSTRLFYGVKRLPARKSAVLQPAPHTLRRILSTKFFSKEFLSNSGIRSLIRRLIDVMTQTLPNLHFISAIDRCCRENEQCFQQWLDTFPNWTNLPDSHYTKVTKI